MNQGSNFHLKCQEYIVLIPIITAVVMETFHFKITAPHSVKCVSITCCFHSLTPPHSLTIFYLFPATPFWDMAILSITNCPKMDKCNHLFSNLIEKLVLNTVYALTAPNTESNGARTFILKEIPAQWGAWKHVNI